MSGISTEKQHPVDSQSNQPKDTWGNTWPTSLRPQGDNGLSSLPQQVDDDQYVAEEEVTTVPGWMPSVTLEVKNDIEMGEENEEELYVQRSKLYRFRDGDWKERGTGDVKLLRHKNTGKVRFLLRQEKTMKIVANHYIINEAPYCDLRPNAGSAKCWVWTVIDCADGEPVVEQFALKFGTPELAAKFFEAYEEAKGAPEAPTPNVVTPAPTSSSKNTSVQQAPVAGQKAEIKAKNDVLDESTPNIWQQVQTGWRCATCRLQWDDTVIECGACETPRPGYEDYAAQERLEKEKGLQDAAAAFLGSSGQGGPAAPPATGFGLPPASTQDQTLSSPPLFVVPPSGPPPASGPAAPQFTANGPFGVPGASPVFGFTPTAAPTAPGASSFIGFTPTPAPTAPSASSVVGFPSVSAPTAPVANSSIGFPSVTGGMNINPVLNNAPFVPVAHPNIASSQDQPGNKLDASFLAVVVEAVMAAVAKNTSNTPTTATVNMLEADIRKADEQVKRLEEKTRDLEERCNRAEERARKADERARRKEDELDEIRQQIRHETAQLRRKQQEDNDAVRQLSEKQMEDKHILDSLKKDIKHEREERKSLEASNASVSENFQAVLKVAEKALGVAQNAEQFVLQMRNEKKEDLTTVSTAISTAVDAVEHSTKERLAALELKLDNSSLDALRTMSVPSRISLLQSLHMQQTGRQLQGGKQNGGCITLLPKSLDADVSQKGESHPLLRRIP